jgi:serine phosphatase RsbU (regulator of sigma subunit)
MSLASFDGAQATMTWLGVGNVEGFLVRADGVETIAMRGGTIGYMLPPLNPRTLSVQPGDTLVFASDGIRHGFRSEVTAARNPREIADEVLAHYRKSFDDACVVVARYLGGTLVS